MYTYFVIAFFAIILTIIASYIAVQNAMQEAREEIEFMEDVEKLDAERTALEEFKASLEELNTYRALAERHRKQKLSPDDIAFMTNFRPLEQKLEPPTHEHNSDSS